MRKLYIGNKNYSSWSMRPWMLMKPAGIPFEEVRVRFDAFDADSQFKLTLANISPTGKVPLLFGTFTIADAYFAPVCTRIKTYALPVPTEIAAYVGRVLALSGVQDWISGALAKQDFRPFKEPYRLRP